MNDADIYSSQGENDEERVVVEENFNEDQKRLELAKQMIEKAKREIQDTKSESEEDEDSQENELESNQRVANYI